MKDTFHVEAMIARLEELRLPMAHFSAELREGISRQDAYARFYWLRKELGYLVSQLDTGVSARPELNPLTLRYGTFKK